MGSSGVRGRSGPAAAGMACTRNRSFVWFATVTSARELSRRTFASQPMPASSSRSFGLPVPVNFFSPPTTTRMVPGPATTPNPVNFSVEPMSGPAA